MMGLTQEQEVEYQVQNTERRMDADYLMISIMYVNIYIIYMQRIGSIWS
jgi:hypothetical protein